MPDRFLVTFDVEVEAEGGWNPAAIADAIRAALNGWDEPEHVVWSVTIERKHPPKCGATNPGIGLDRELVCVSEAGHLGSHVDVSGTVFGPLGTQSGDSGGPS